MAVLVRIGEKIVEFPKAHVREARLEQKNCFLNKRRHEKTNFWEPFKAYRGADLNCRPSGYEIQLLMNVVLHVVTFLNSFSEFT